MAATVKRATKKTTKTVKTAKKANTSKAKGAVAPKNDTTICINPATGEKLGEFRVKRCRRCKDSG